MKNKSERPLAIFGSTLAFLLAAIVADAMPSSNQPKPLAAASRVTSSPTNPPPAWQATLNQGISAWLGQQVLARQKAAARRQAPTPSLVREAELQRLNSVAGGGVTAAFHHNGTPLEIKGPMLQPPFIGPARHGMDGREETARSFLRASRSLLLLEDPDGELALRTRESDHLGRQHLRFRQEYKSLPVWPAEVIVHLDPSGNVDLLDGAFVPTPQLDIQPALSAEQALDKAKDRLAKGSTPTTTIPELIVYGPLDEPSRLAWKFDLIVGFSQAWRCAVDARDGSVLAAFSLINEGAVTGSGLDGLGTSRTLHLWQQGSTFYMEDTSKQMFDSTSTPPNPDTTRGAIFIWDSHNTPPTNNPSATENFLGNPAQSTSTASGSGWVSDAVGAAFGLAETYDYYLARHNRNSLDGNGGSISGFVRVGINWRNAFWTQAYKIMVFGDTLPNGLDVCAHELTHGVIFSTGDGGILNYHDQPGAMNEAFADIFGENVEARTKGTNDWLMGEDTVLGALRNMADPGSLNFGGNPYPSKMSEYYELGPDQDHGGVHENSSIINHCYYLLAGGLDGAIGISEAEKIFYRAMTLHLAKESQFIDCRHACISSAQELFGTNSTQALKTAQAFDAVEIVDAPTTPDPSPVPVVQGADSTLFLRWDPFANFTGEYDLFRRESAKGDTSFGTFIGTINYLAPERLSVSGDGSFIFYVTVDNDYGAVNTDGSSPALGGSPGLIHSLAMTPDASRFAFVPLDSFGDPTNYIGIIDLAAQTTKLVKLYGLDSEGNKADIIRYADVLDFTADGKTLVYDAYSEFRTANSNIFSGWTIYSMDIATTNITALISLNGNFDFGNPSLGKRRNNVVTFEVVNKQSAISSVVAADLFSGKGATIGNLGIAQALGKPDYTGDDGAIVYASPDFSANSGYSLVRQPMASDGLTTNGAPSVWLSDGDFATIYRRGTYAASNSLPSVHLTSPTDGQVFPASSDITFQATASDVDGTVAKVEFYQGSTKVGEATATPYSFTWSQVPAGTYSLIARAIDNLGGTTDSIALSVMVGNANRPKLSDSRIVAGHLQFSIEGAAGTVLQIQQSSDLQNWSPVGSVTIQTGTTSFQDPAAVTAARKFYRAQQQ